MAAAFIKSSARRSLGFLNAYRSDNLSHGDRISKPGCAIQAQLDIEPQE
jgi:hypothetical protein